MEMLFKEDKVHNSSEVFYFHQGSHIQDLSQIATIKRYLKTKIDIQYSELFQVEKSEFSLCCYFIGTDISVEEKATFAKRILYFINCRQYGSLEFVLCSNCTTKKEILLEYVDGTYQRELPDYYFDAILQREYAHLFNKEVESRYRVIGYTTNIGFNGEVLTSSLFVQLIIEDAEKRVLDLFQLPSQRGKLARSGIRPLHYSSFVIKRVSSVIALSDFVVKTLAITPETYVVMRFRLNRTYLAFLNFDDDEYDIHFRLRKSCYARISNLDTNKFPIVVYLNQISRVDLFSLLDHDVEYELSATPEFFESNYWYQLIY